MSVKDVLKHYVPPVTRDDRARDCVARPIAANPYFQIEQHLLWPENLLPMYGEKCRRALHVNGYHILLCRRRIFVLRDDQVFSFPPLDSFVWDVYVESIDKDTLLVVIAHDTGVRVGKVNHEFSGEVLDESSLSTSSPAVKIHRLRRNTFCLCYADCRVQNLVVQEGQHAEMVADLQPDQGGWLTAAARLLLPARRREYVDSFYDAQQRHLVVLSDHDVSLWAYEEKEDSSLSLLCSSPVPVRTAIAVVPPSDRETVGSLVLRFGARVSLALGTRAKDGASVLVTGSEEALPSTVADVITISEAREGANATLLYDEIGCSLVLMGRDGDAPAEPMVVSQITLPEKLSGIAFVGQSDTNDHGVFWLYTHSPLTFRVERVSRGMRLQQQFSRSRPQAAAFLETLPPARRASLIMEAALDGLSLGDLDRAIAPLMRPIIVDSHTMSLSPGAEGFVHFFMHLFDGLNQLCASIPYWGLSADLDAARTRSAQCCTLLRTYLTPNGWLDCDGDAPRKAQWIKYHAISPCPLDEPTATHIQGYFLATLLNVVHHAGTLAWLYALLLDAGLGECFSKTVLPSLWDSATNPEEIETAYIMQLLDKKERGNDTTVTQKLLEEGDLVPRKAQLAAHVTGLLQEGNAKGALDYASNHIQEIIHHDLFVHVANMLEESAPSKLPRIRLLLQAYHFNPATSTEVLAMLKEISPDGPDGTERLKRNLECIFKDESAQDLHSIVLDWMESHPLDDPRIELFANVIANLDVEVSLSNTLTGTFFSCWCEEMRGNMAVAARNFGRLAQTPLECPLASRLVCITHARRYDPEDEDKHTEFILLLQRQLAELLEEHMASAAAHGRLVAPLEQIQLDLTALGQHFLDESALFEVAGRYHELGGASIQLDILKIHSDAPEEVTSEALLAMLAFLQATGRTSTEAVHVVLQEYLNNFEGVLPLNPFIMFLAFDSVRASELAKVLLECGVDARTLFETLLGLIDPRGRETQFPVCDILQTLTEIVDRVPAGQQNVCVSYLVECIRGMLAGEYRSLTLTQSDIFSLRSMDAVLEKRLRHSR